MLESLTFQVIILAVSLLGLASASHFAIKSVEKIVEITGLSEASVGFIILSVLTSTPEIIVAIFSVSQGNAGVSIGDILGSNVFNIAFVVGLLGILGYIKICCTDLLVELTDMLSVILLIPLLLVVSQFQILEIPSQLVGALLLIAFFVSTYLIARKRTPPVRSNGASIINRKTGRVILTLLGSFAVVVVSAQFTVISASNIAVTLGVPAVLVGAKIVAIGTSLPELTLDLAAIRRGRMQLAIGGIIGSNLTNLTLVLGLVLLTSSFNVDLTVFIEIIPFLIISTVIFWRFIIRGGVSRIAGLMLILTYILFQILVV